MKAGDATPGARAFLTAEWRDLVMLNYAVDPALLRPVVPAGTELDQFEGTTFLSLVGFRFTSTRVLGIAFPGHRDFEEVNLRFYVRRREGGESRRGVVFLRELVPRRIIAWVARAWYNEPYRAIPMRHAIAPGPAGRELDLRYEWLGRAGWEGIRMSARGTASEPSAGSLSEFITEHYWGYTRQRDGSTIEYRVAHPRWTVREGTDSGVRGDLEALYGRTLGRAISGPPLSSFWAEGSPVTVHRPRLLGRDHATR